MAATATAAAAATAVPAMGREFTFRFEWIEGGGSAAGRDAFVDVGHVAARFARGRGDSIVIRRRVALRLDGPGVAARVSVALAAETPGCTVRVDGLAVSSVPRVIQPLHRLGVAVVHDIEMSIPAGVPAGAFLTNMQWIAESD